MAIPDFQSCMRPLLSVIADGNIHKFQNALDQVCDFFDLSEAERRELLPSGKQAIIRNRVAWSGTYLKKAGLITAPGRSLLQITELGQQALNDCPERVDVKYLKQFPAFATFHTSNRTPTDRLKADPNGSDTTPEERLGEAYAELFDALADELLQTIKAGTPEFFETLVVDLMLAMGYGGSRREAGNATQLSNDDGIDGIINEDKLGLDIIYLQAKRWENTVQRPEIDKFIGALTRRGARKGVFITTSNFSTGALQAGKGLAISVVLIDGQQLARLMIENDLGVTTKETYRLKQIDSDYFNAE